LINYLKNNKYLLFLVFILSSIVSAQNNLDPNISWFSDPSNISDSTDYDHNTQTILITNYVGGYPLNLPTYFSQSEYQEYLFNQNFYNYWRERIELSNSNQESGKIGLSGQISNRIFGGSVVDIKPQGSAELIFSGVINKIDNPALPEEQRKTTSFNFDERIQMNVIGRIGDKLQLQANYDTEATFEFENEIKLEYTGDEDDIVKKIELGNVSLPLSGSLITGAQSLFGVKTKLQFGKTTLTTVFSEQKSETSSIEIQGGAQMTEFELSIDDYEENKHFFLAQYFYESYDQAMNPELLPIISSAINITKIEVYVTNKNSTTTNTRNILALQDLGEHSAINQTNSLVQDNNIPFPYVPDNLNNSLNPSDFVAEVENNTSDSIRDISEITSAFNSISYDGFNQGLDYEKIENARRLSSSEYSINSQLGFISLNQALGSDEILAVAFQYTYMGETYQVGEFATDVTAPSTLILKLLKSTMTDISQSNWNLLMKNVYSLGAYQINREDFILDILHQNDSLGAPVNFLTQGPIGLKETPLLQVFGLDNLNSNNDPGSDGVFDFIDGVLINSSNGRIYFPTTKPFGCALRKKFSGTNVDCSNPSSLDPFYSVANLYCFDALYDSTQSAAQQIAELNKFLLRGQYKSSVGSEISLNAMNIPEGSVKVSAGGRLLEENIHYTVDYTMGRVRIIDEGVLGASEPIRITLENNSLFNFQSKRFMGAHIDYKVNNDFIIGASALNLTEKPLTQKINIGDEPISNTIIGLNSSYSRDSRFLTKIIDKLPLIETKEVSNIAINSEFAYFIPGHPKSINIDETGTSYIDDFENSQSGIDIRNASAWSLSSTPQGNIGSEYGYFPEATYSNQLKYGYNRAKLAWYVIDPLFQRNSTITPAHIVNDTEQQTNHYVREVFINEVFPNKDQQTGQPSRLRTLDMAFYPDERGPYNFDVEPSDYSAGIDENGYLKEPKTRWGGMTRKIETNDFEAANIEFIEFWMMDPFLYEPDHSGGDLFINLGNISEDILKDSRKSFENGLPIDGSDTNIDTTIWGRVPSIQSLVNAFDNDEGARENQDLGYDGLDDVNELIFHNEYLERIQTTFANTTDSVYIKAELDPSADNFKYFRSTDFDNSEASILRRYKDYNGVQGNSPTSDQSTEEYPTSATNLPDVEDINNDQTLSESEGYYQYRINLKPDELVQGSNYINDIYTDSTQGPSFGTRWIQFKIPIQNYSEKVGTIEDFKSIRFIRTFLTGFEDTVVCRFATLELVRGEWRRYLNNLSTGNEEVFSNNATQFDISVVNYEENAHRSPVPYNLPPGIERETMYGATSFTQQNEQSMVLKISDLEDGDARAAFKNVSMDMRNYQKIEMHAHAEALQQYGLLDDSLHLFLRIGSDYINNYYEYSVPLKTTDWYVSKEDRGAIWPDENSIDLELNLLQAVKQARNNLDFAFDSLYQETDDNGRIVSVVGNPNLGNIKTIMLGVRNPIESIGANGQSQSAEIWVNELRLTGFNEKGGWAARTQVRLRLADFANIAFAGSMSTVGFGSLEKNISERNLEDSKRYNLTASLELGQLFPEKSNIKFPMYVSVSESKDSPQYNPLDPDILLETSLAVAEQEGGKVARDSLERIVQNYTKIKSVNFTNVRKERPPGKNTSKIYDLENFSLSYSYNEVNSSNINTEYLIRKDHAAGLGYNFNTNPKNIKPFSKLKFLKKGKYLRLIKDFNFYYSPKQFSFRTDFNKSYLETKMRNTSGVNLELPAMYSKLFTMSRIYNMKYDLTRSIKLNFSASNQSIVDEPYGKIETKAQRDSIWSNILSLGRPTSYHHNFDIRYTLPISKVPILSWINSSINYDANYDWRSSSLAAQNYGNTIQNNNSIKLNTQFNLTSLYNKVPVLKKILSNNSANKTRIPSRGGVRNNQKNNDDVDDDSDIKFKLLRYIAKGIFSVKNLSISYTETNGTLLPGFLPETQFLGLNRPFSSPAPTLGFVLGSQNDIREQAAMQGWLTTDTLLNYLYTQTYSNNLNLRATVEPVSRFKIMFTGSRRYSENENEYFRNTSSDLSNPTFEHISNTKSGNFNISFLPIRTAFIGDRADNSSELFDNFLNYRFNIAQRLANEEGVVQDWPDGYGPSSQQVLIPAFLSAYSGTDPDRQSLNAFPRIPMPNWNINFNGFTKIRWVKNNFKNVTMSHSYRSTYSVGSFISNMNYLPVSMQELNSDIYGGNYVPEFQIDQVNITEQFAPFFKLDITMNNSMTTRIEYKKDRTISLNLSNSQITEVKGFEYIVGLGYRIQGVRLMFDGGGGQKQVDSDLDLRADISIRNNKTIIRRIEEETNQPTSGQSLITLKFSADYVINNRVNLKLFYDQVVTDYVVSSSFPTSNTNIGVSLRLTLM
tara:strand:- start:12506 stop:19615 length:7110 start_codon:yes stop_codon:yes gene_type:complete